MSSFLSPPLTKGYIKLNTTYFSSAFIFVSFSWLFNLISFFLSFSAEATTLFRATTLASTLMEQYMKATATHFVHHALKDCILKIMESKQSCEVIPWTMYFFKHFDLLKWPTSSYVLFALEAFIYQSFRNNFIYMRNTGTELIEIFLKMLAWTMFIISLLNKFNSNFFKLRIYSLAVIGYFFTVTEWPNINLW